MGLAEKLFGVRDATAKRSANDYIDLSEYGTAPGAEATGATYTIRVCEVNKYEDLKEFAGLVYDGNVLMMDFTKLSADAIQLKRAITDLRRLAQDVGGDVAGVGEHMVVVCPSGVRVDKRKLKPGQ